VCQRLDSDGQALLATLGRHYDQAIKSPLGLSTEFVTTIRTHGRDDRVEWTCWLESLHGLAAPRPAPQPLADTAVALRVHETFLERYAAVHLAGRTLTSTDLSRELVPWASSVPANTPPGAKVAAASEPWSLTLLEERPVICQIENGLLSLHLRVKEFSAPDSVYPAVSVRIALRPSSRAGGWTLTREGPVEVHPLDYVPGSGQSLSGRQLSLRRAMQRKLEKTLTAEIPVPAWKMLATREGALTLQPRQMRTADGWLAIEWQVSSLPVSSDAR
jgi:hypothetical protein